jgi:glycosyltransferase involved in cell wall biosynthesis
MAVNNGLPSEQLILMDYVPDNELLALYLFCELYIIPSLLEGYGLPALEAMVCGAPVIVSNTISIPEVIGFDDALFDPYSIESIVTKIVQVMTNDDFRELLRAHPASHFKYCEF